MRAPFGDYSLHAQATRSAPVSAAVTIGDTLDPTRSGEVGQCSAGLSGHRDVSSKVVGVADGSKHRKRVVDVLI
jgi:hypothetical protein